MDSARGVKRLAAAARIGTAAVGIALCAACAPPSHVLTGTPRPPLRPEDVIVYSRTPPSYREIARLDAHRKTLFNGGGEHSTDEVVKRLKAEAARLGANGLLLDGFDQTEMGSIGSGAGTDSYSAHGSVSLGFGVAVGIFKTTGRGRAIYVPPG